MGPVGQVTRGHQLMHHGIINSTGEIGQIKSTRITHGESREAQLGQEVEEEAEVDLAVVIPEVVLAIVKRRV